MRILNHPATTYKWAVRIFLGSGPLAVLLLFAWGFKVHPLGDRPTLVLMAYMLVLMAAVCALSVAALAGCHMATHKAFSAGYQTGRQAASEAPAATGEPHLQLVE